MSASSLSGLKVEASAEEATDCAGDGRERGRRLVANAWIARALEVASRSDIVAKLCFADTMFWERCCANRRVWSWVVYNFVMSSSHKADLELRRFRLV